MNAFAKKISIGIVLSGLVYQLGYGIQRQEFTVLLFYYSILFLSYISIIYWVKCEKDIHFFVGLGIFLRFLLLFSLPNLSDDLYRFIWDGRLIQQGINPFDHIPSYYIQNIGVLEGLTPELYRQLNSADYFTIYPPVNQLIFTIAAGCFPTSIWGSSLVMKSFLFVFEVGGLWLIIQLLQYFQLAAKNVLLYALNPLIILEIVGNLHFEGAMIFFLLLAIWLLVVKENEWLSAVTFALAVASKLLPLMFLPLLIRRIGQPERSVINVGIQPSLTDWSALNWKKIGIYLILLACTLFVLFLPLFNSQFLLNYSKSLNLYFQKFEFNGSLYYVLRWIGFQLKGYNIIQTLAPALAVIAFIGILWIALVEKKAICQTIFERMLWTICLYLFCAATVHPWYVAMPVVLCVFTCFRFPTVWSGLIFLTYINYSYEPYYENLWLVGLEYVLLVAYLGYELFLVSKSKIANWKSH